MTPFYQGNGITLYCGDCLDVMPQLDEQFDTIITDPPYGLEFMGKDWDRGVPGVRFWQAALQVAKPGAMLLAFGGTRTHHRLMCAIEDAGWEIRDVIMWVYGSGFPKSHDISKAIDKAAGAEREVIRECDSTYGMNKTRVEQGYRPNEVKPGAITAPATEAAALWDGWGTALKPAWEPIIVAMKPRDTTKWVVRLTPELLDEWEAIERGYE
jgi:site-specific DNA-methyltransferase (adenine-specific)